MQSVETFVTPRMRATRITIADFDDLFRMNQDPEVAKTMAGKRSESETRDFIRNSLEHWERHGYGFWIFRDRHYAHEDGADAGSFIGRAGIRHVAIENAPEVELAYALMPEFWRRGIATEMSRGILQIAATLDIPNLVAFTLPTNVGSRAVIEKVGFEYERDIRWANLAHVLYRKKLRRF